MKIHSTKANLKNERSLEPHSDLTAHLQGAFVTCPLSLPTFPSNPNPRKTRNHCLLFKLFIKQFIKVHIKTTQTKKDNNNNSSCHSSACTQEPLVCDQVCAET